MTPINVDLHAYNNAEDGSLLIRKDGKWVVITFEELNKENVDKMRKLDELSIKFGNLAEAHKHFVKYAKSHFMVVFNYLKIKVLGGEIDVEPEILSLDEKVLNGEISVEEALQKHEFLQTTFEKIYSDKKELITFPEV